VINSKTGTRGVPTKQGRGGVRPPRSSPGRLLRRTAPGEKAALVALVRLGQSSFLGVARRMLALSLEALGCGRAGIPERIQDIFGTRRQLRSAPRGERRGGFTGY